MAWYMFPLIGIALIVFYFFCGRFIVQGCVYLWRGMRTDARGREVLMKEMRAKSEARRNKRDLLHGRRRVAAEKLSRNSQK